MQQHVCNIKINQRRNRQIYYLIHSTKGEQICLLFLFTYCLGYVSFVLVMCSLLGLVLKKLSYSRIYRTLNISVTHERNACSKEDVSCTLCFAAKYVTITSFFL